MIIIAEQASNIWIDHNTFQNSVDEILYVGSGSRFKTGVPPRNVTISWNHCVKPTSGWTDKCLLISEHTLTMDSAVTITLHHNRYQTYVRNPSADWATIHSFNNYYDVTEIGAQLTNHAKYLSENDVYLARKDGAYPWVKVYDIGGLADSVAVRNPYQINPTSTYEQLNPQLIFTPPYPYTLDTADATLQSRIVAGAGWQNVTPPSPPQNAAPPSPPRKLHVSQ
jgi:pectate lyase